MNSKTCSVRIKRVITGLLILLLVIIIVAGIYLNSLMPVITGYPARYLCSAVFISEREQEDVEQLDLNFSFIRFVKNDVDKENKTVTSRFLWGKSIAVYRDGHGACLVQEQTPGELSSQEYPDITAYYSGDTIQWPLGDILPDSLITGALEKISSGLINDDAYGGTAFAFMVLHKGIPVAEAYKPEFSRDTRFLSWSMAKSVTNAIVGIMVKDSMIDITERGLIPEWTADGRNEITLENLMHMQSGLEWNEDYGNRSDVTVMLHCEPDFAAYAYSRPLEEVPGTHWYYSSGTTNIVSYILRKRFESDTDYYSFPHNELFYKIGITDAVFETDESGTLTGSSYLYMTARDYARFALLYLRDGVFCGERILPEGWVDYSVQPASDSHGEYGSFFWLNRDGSFDAAPRDMYMCVGHDGQRIFIIPSMDLIVVVLGYSPDNSMDFSSLMKDIIGTLE